MPNISVSRLHVCHSHVFFLYSERAGFEVVRAAVARLSAQVFLHSERAALEVVSSAVAAKRKVFSSTCDKKTFIYGPSCGI